MKLICDICKEQYYAQVDPHEIGEPRICSDACAWKLSNNGGPKPPKVEEEVFYATVTGDVYPHGELYETNFEHGHYISIVFTATPFRNCIVRIVMQKIRDLRKDEQEPEYVKRYWNQIPKEWRKRE